MATPTSNEALCAYAFHALQAAFGGHDVNNLPKGAELDDAAVAGGLFVSYETLEGVPRGVLGVLEPVALLQSVRGFALTAALNDPRFPPINPEELPGIRVVVSVLSAPVKVGGWQEWTPGVHGVAMSYEGADRPYATTFLPQVIKEQGWTREQTFEHLFRKAGYEGPVTPDMFEKCEVSAYTGTVCKLPYTAYVADYKDVWGLGKVVVE